MAPPILNLGRFDRSPPALTRHPLPPLHPLHRLHPLLPLHPPLALVPRLRRRKRAIPHRFHPVLALTLALRAS